MLFKFCTESLPFSYLALKTLPQGIKSPFIIKCIFTFFYQKGQD